MTVSLLRSAFLLWCATVATAASLLNSHVTTMMVGEEGGDRPPQLPDQPPVHATTMAVGEEAHVTTMMVGEEGGDRPPQFPDQPPVHVTTMMVGEEDGDPHEKAVKAEHEKMLKAQEQQELERQNKAVAAEAEEKAQAAEQSSKQKAAEQAEKDEAAAIAEATAKEQAAADEAAKKAEEQAAKAAEKDEKTAAAERQLKQEEADERAAKEKLEKADVEERALKAWEEEVKNEKAGKAVAERAAKDAVIEAKAKAAAIAAEKALKVSEERASKDAAAAEKVYKQEGSERAHKDYSEKLDKSSLMHPTPPPTPPYSGCHAGGWFKPSSVVSAACTSEQRPAYDPGAVGGEPAGTCNADDRANAGKLLAGGETYLRAASGSGKVYTFVYAFDRASWINELHLAGRSTGAFAKHNDNRFAAAFSVDGTTWSHEYAVSGCQDLGSATCTLRLSRQVQMHYVKLVVRSSCAGCNNADYVTSLRVKCAASGLVEEPAPPTCTKVAERCTLQGVPSLRLGSNTCAWGLVQLGPLGLRFTASKCVSRRNFCGAQRDDSCGPSTSPVASRLTISTLTKAKSYVNLHEDGTMDFMVADGGCVTHVTAAPKAAAGAHFQDPATGTDAYILYENNGLQIHSSGLSIDCAAVGPMPTTQPPTLQPQPPNTDPVCEAAGCPHQYGFAAGCAFHGDCMGDHETSPSACHLQGGVWCDPSGGGGTQPQPQPPHVTTMAVGEEGGDSQPPVHVTTMAVGEEDGDSPPQLPDQPPVHATTMAVGEEAHVTTMAVGEEGGDSQPPLMRATTMAVGEER